MLFVSLDQIAPEFLLPEAPGCISVTAVPYAQPEQSPAAATQAGAGLFHDQAESLQRDRLRQAKKHS